MNLFFDTNILLDIALRRDPFVVSSQAIFTDAVEHHQCFVSWHSISNLAYILAKVEEAALALEFIRNIISVCRIAPVEHKDMAIAFEHNTGDLEDAMQIASALSVGADMIVTRDHSEFMKSPIPVTAPNS